MTLVPEGVGVDRDRRRVFSATEGPFVSLSVCPTALCLLRPAPSLLPLRPPLSPSVTSVRLVRPFVPPPCSSLLVPRSDFLLSFPLSHSLCLRLPLFSVLCLHALSLSGCLPCVSIPLSLSLCLSLCFSFRLCLWSSFHSSVVPFAPHCLCFTSVSLTCLSPCVWTVHRSRPLLPVPRSGSKSPPLVLRRRNEVDCPGCRGGPDPGRTTSLGGGRCGLGRSQTSVGHPPDVPTLSPPPSSPLGGPEGEVPRGGVRVKVGSSSVTWKLPSVQ